LEWSDREKPNAAWARRYGRNYDLAMSFLEQSRKSTEAEAQEKEQQRRKGLRRTQYFASIVSLLFLVTSVIALYANNQREAALQGGRISRQFSYVANMQLAAKAFDERSYGRSIELLDRFLPDASRDAREDVRSFYWYYLWRLNHDEQ